MRGFVEHSYMESWKLGLGSWIWGHMRSHHANIYLPNVFSTRAWLWEAVSLSSRLICYVCTVDFSLVETENDVWWDKLHDRVNNGPLYPSGESEDSAMHRGVMFLRWLMQR